MTETLTIDRIVASSPDDGHGLPARVERIMRHVADERLERELGSNSLGGEGNWCIREVAVSAVLDLQRPDPSLEEALAQAVLDAIAAAMGERDVVQYPRLIDALVDLVASASMGRFERAWAWERVGIISDAAELERRPGACVLDALAQRPADVVAAIIRVVSEVGLAPLHRMFGVSGWVGLADIVISAHLRAAARPDVRAMLRDHEVEPAAVTAADIVRASRLVSSSQLAAAARGSRLRFDGQTSRALAVLVVAEAEPGMLPAKRVVPMCLTLAQLVAGTLPLVAEGSSAAGGSVSPREPIEATLATGLPADRRPQHGSGDAPAHPPANETDQTDEQLDHTVVEPVDQPVGDATVHAGLLFLVNAASDATMPGALFDDLELDGIAPSELLARVALLLIDAVDDDPAVLAFAGSDAKRLRPGWSHKALPPDVFERIEAYVGAWAAATAARLRRDDEDPLEVVAEMARRSGRIEREQGWIDVHLGLADVDVDVRLAGLDIDPGWVPWLGSVVRFRYA